MGLLDDAIREHLELKRRRGADAGDISREESEALGPVRRAPDGAPDLSDTDTDTDTATDAGGQPPLAGPSWESDETRVLEATPAPHEPFPGAGGYEPPPAPADHPPPSAAEPPSGAYEPPARSYEPPTTGYEPPPPPPPPPASPPPASERQWYERADESEPDPFAGEPDPDATPDFEPEPEHPSLLSRFRVGRRSKPDPPPPASDEPTSSFQPPSPPSSYEPPSPYEPPPAPNRPAYGYEPPPASHEPDIVPADDEPDVEDVLGETPDFLEETPEHDRLWFEQRPPRDFDFDDK